MDPSPNSPTDEKIALEVQQGNIDSFRLLVEKYQGKLLRYGKKFLSSRHDIEDLVQDIFLKAYKNIQSFDTRKKFSPWIYRVAHNEFINAIQKNKRLPIPIFNFDELLPHLITEEILEQELDKKKLQGMLNKSLDKINIKYREPLILYYFEEMNYQEIADILQTPTSTVGIRLKRGKYFLKKLFKEEYNDYDR